MLEVLGGYAKGVWEAVLTVVEAGSAVVLEVMVEVVIYKKCLEIVLKMIEFEVVLKGVRVVIVLKVVMSCFG